MKQMGMLVGNFGFKVVPLFCTAHPLLRITLRYPRWRGSFPLARKEQNKGRFCRAKAFIRNNNATDRLKASWLAIEKQEMKEMCLIPKSAVVFHFAAVELWNY